MSFCLLFIFKNKFLPVAVFGVNWAGCPSARLFRANVGGAHRGGPEPGIHNRRPE
jgi:hypothetical protein